MFKKPHNRIEAYMDMDEMRAELQELVFRLQDAGRGDLASKLVKKSRAVGEKLSKMALLNIKAQREGDDELLEYSYKAGDQLMVELLEEARKLIEENLSR